MAVNEKVNIEVSDNGSINKVTKNASGLNAELDKAAKTSTRIPVAMAAAKAGMDARNAAGGQTGQESSTARGIGGLTGAAGRDFAAQAQGLGGLVHVYATFAANLFAISAAFTALSKAADTTNMVKGLDQLGAASGRGLGSLAKRLSEVTDGAISMRDAMTATAQASAGGMSGQNILRLGKVAKQASQALGIDMPNAVSRLSRGITKLEPELLDEIGIMVRVDRASEEYARTLGKSASALTDFEKRQGFANAVLEQGEKKFGAIDLAANPYAKILASIQNLTQSGLELVNKVMAPLLNVLSSSPTALAIVLAGIAATLLKQAIPAIGMFRENARRMADEAQKRVARQLKDQQEAAVKSDVIASRAAELSFQREKTTLDKIDALRKTRTNKNIVSEQSRQVIKSDIFEVPPDRLTALKKESDILLATTDKTLQEQGKKLAKYYENADALRRENTIRGDAAAQANEQRDNKWYAHQEQLTRNAKRLNDAQVKRSILLNTADNAATLGAVQAFKQLREETSKADLGKFAKGMLTLQGSFSIATTAISTFLGAFQTWFMAIGLVIGAIALLDGWLSKAEKESANFSSSLNLVNSAADNVQRTLDKIWSKDAKDVLSVESIQAKANAFNELSDAITASVRDFSRLTAAWSGWEKFTDWVKDGFGAGAADKLATGLSTSIISSLKLMEEGPAKEAAKKSIQNLIGSSVDVGNFDSLESALRKLTDRDIATKAAEIAKQVSNINREVNNAAAPLIKFSATLDDMDKTLADINVSLKATDNFSKLGSQLIDSSFLIGEALKNPTNAIIALKKVVESTNQLSLLDENLAIELVESKNAILNVTEQIGEYSKELTKAKEEHSKLMVEINKEGGLDSARLKGSDAILGGKELLDREKGLRDQVDSLSSLLDKANKDSNSFIERFGNRINISLFEKGSKLLIDSLKGAWEQAGIGVSKAYLSIISKAGGRTADLETKLAVREIEIQIELIKSQFSLSTETKRLGMIIEREGIDRRIEIAREDAKSGSEQLRDRASKELPELEKSRARVDLQLQKIDQDSKTFIKEFTAFSKRMGPNTPEEEGRIELERQVLSKMDTYVQELIAKEKLIAAKSGQIRETTIMGKSREMDQNVNIGGRLIDTNNTALEARQRETDRKQAASPFFDQELQIKKSLIESEIFENNVLKSKLKLLGEMVVIEELIKSKKLKPEDLERAEGVFTAMKEELENYDEKTGEDRAALANKQLNEEIVGRRTLVKLMHDRQNREHTFNRDNQAAILDNLELQLTYMKNIGAYDEEIAARKSATIALDRQRLANNDAEFNLRIAKEQELSEISSKKAQAELNGLDPSYYAELWNTTNNYYIGVLSKLQNINAEKLNSIALDEQLKISLARQASEMAKLVSITESLGTAFGTMGTALGKTTEALVALKNNDINYLNKKKTLQDEIWELQNNGDEEGAIKAKKKLAAEDKKHISDQLMGINKAIAAGKTMFKEKTAAYKILSGIEKANSVISAGLRAKELTDTLSKIKTTITETIPGIYAKAMDLLGPIVGPIAATAAIAAFIGSGFSSGGTPPAGFSAEDQQAVQGTGQSYVNGTLVDNGGGKLGDPKALSTTIVDGIDRLEKVYFEMLDFDKGKTYKALVAIRDNTYGMAKSLGVSSGIIGGKSAFGTVEGSKKVLGGLWGSSVQVLDKGIELVGTIASLGSGSGIRNIYENVKKTSSVLFGLISSSSYRTNYSAISNEAVNTAITDIFDSMGDVLLSSAEALGASQSTVLNTINSMNLNLKVSSKDLSGEEFAEAVMAEIGIQLDKAATTAFPQLKALQDKFQDFGESTADFLIRIVDDQKQVQLAFDSIGRTFEDLTIISTGLTTKMNSFLSVFFKYTTYFNTFTQTISKAEISQILIDASGGLDEFVSNIESFSGSFLTEAERLAPVQAALTRRLSELGYSSVDTRDEFKNLIRTFEFVDEASIKTYAELLALSDAFNEVYPELKKVLSAEELRTQRLSQYIEILKLEEKIGEALILQRLEELATIEDSLKAGQLYLYALQDEATLKSKLKTAYDKEKSAINSTITALKNSIKTLEDYRNSLFTGANSTLTPLQKYDESKVQLLQTASLAGSTAITEEEKKAKEDAINKLPTVSSAFLEASRTMFASSAQYTADFNTVLNLVSSTSSALEVQLTTAEQQLAELEQSVSFLGFIEENTKTTAQLLSDYSVAHAVTTRAQADYSMNLNMMTAELISKSGLTNSLLETMLASIAYNAPSMSTAAANAPDYWTNPLAAPAAPTMSIPTEPDRAYALSASNDATLVELQAIRAELERLRTEQQAQTGDLIATNYDATQTATAEQIEAQQQIIYDNAWLDRNGYPVPGSFGT